MGAQGAHRHRTRIAGHRRDPRRRRGRQVRAGRPRRARRGRRLRRRRPARRSARRHRRPPAAVAGRGLRRLLRSLGLDATALPSTLDEAAARYRSLTSARNLLVILDDALDPGQVRPLIPAGPECAVIVTSRRIMAAPDLPSHLHLGGLGHAEAAALFARLADPGRLRAEPEAAHRIVRRCGGLPLALRIAAAHLAARPGRTLSRLADQLADPSRRLDALEHADLSMRDTIAVGLQHLPEEPAGHDAAHAFFLLGLQETPVHTAAALSALTGWPERRAEAALNQLLDVRLLEATGPGRCRMHDLTRLYAREQAARHMPEPAPTST
ncbi:NB-ARC domain-containing protein [Nonomuraea sp. KM90]|uniref:NB-ARC domain-containing protein n=1 Tax=Nonomuraea sp. KM90 TaxID=3457428 RepID=UPI003FCCB987